jgi:hypothetical protein
MSLIDATEKAAVESALNRYHKYFQERMPYGLLVPKKSRKKR